MEKELLSIIKTLEFFCDILLGFKIHIHSDHKNLSFNIFKSERVRRCRLLLKDYDHTFTYTPAKDNVIADMIGRYPIHSAAPLELQEVCAPSRPPTTGHQIIPLDVDDDNSCPIDFRVIVHNQKSDQHLQGLLQYQDYSVKKCS